MRTLFNITTLTLLFFIPTLDAQKYFTKSGIIAFLSQAPLENIEATNNSALIVLDVATGKLECSVLIKGFQFEKALMQDHFNENYMESHKFPKAIFKGTLTDMKAVHFGKDGTYTTNLTGDLTLHGVTKPMTTAAKISVKGGNVSATTSFDILVADFNIEIPKVVRDNIADKVNVTVKADLQLMN